MKRQRVVWDRDRVHLYRWTLFQCRWFQIVIHNFRGDDPPDLHDHAWWNVSIILAGVLKETTLQPTPWGGQPAYSSRLLRTGNVRVRSARELHRLSVVQPAWTLFITGPTQREWGYDTRHGWMPWQRYRVKHNAERSPKIVK